MKRFHIHLSVKDLNRSVQFYNQLFDHPADLLKKDYAKWMLEEPRINFAISTKGPSSGLNHLGFQVSNEADLAALKQQALRAGEGKILDEGHTSCCYSNSEKHWTVDPSGIPWEHYRTMGEAVEYGATTEETSACCMPKLTQALKDNCCTPRQL